VVSWISHFIKERVIGGVRVVSGGGAEGRVWELGSAFGGLSWVDVGCCIGSSSGFGTGKGG